MTKSSGSGQISNWECQVQLTLNHSPSTSLKSFGSRSLSNFRITISFSLAMLLSSLYNFNATCERRSIKLLTRQQIKTSRKTTDKNIKKDNGNKCVSLHLSSRFYVFGFKDFTAFAHSKTSDNLVSTISTRNNIFHHLLQKKQQQQQQNWNLHDNDNDDTYLTPLGRFDLQSCLA